MSSPAPWDIREEALHADCRIFQVVRRRLKHPHDSREGDFFVIRCADWVLALPVTADGRIVLVRQYRFGSQNLSWEPPGGVLDPGENPLDAGVRETREETGYTGKSARIIGACSPNPAILGNTAHFALVEDCEPTHPVSFDENEEIETGLFTPAETLAMVADGRIHHAVAIAAIFRLREAKPELFRNADAGTRSAE